MQTSTQIKNNKLEVTAIETATKNTSYSMEQLLIIRAGKKRIQDRITADLVEIDGWIVDARAGGMKTQAEIVLEAQTSTSTPVVSDSASNLK